MRERLAIAVLALLLPMLASAREAPPAADDPVIEQRMLKVAEELRCLVCQNQTIADSHADLAVDLRKRIVEMMRQGKSDREVIDFMVERYGDFVLYRPRFSGKTLLLWLGPALLAVGGLVVLVVTRRRVHSRIEDRELSDEERQRARSLLEGKDIPEAR
jgi:cytochrome c-type biogenesis protein CcmH